MVDLLSATMALRTLTATLGRTLLALVGSLI